MFSKLDALLLSAFLYFLSYPFAFHSANLIPDWVSATVIWFAFVPLFVLLRGLPPAESFRKTFGFGVIANGAILFWIIIAMKKYGGLSILLSGGIMALMILALATYSALAAFATAVFRNRAPAWLTGTLFFTLMEWVRVYVPFGGFPWAAPANALAGSLYLVQAADRIGVTGLNLVIFFTNFALAELVIARRERRPLPRLLPGSAAVLFLVLLTYGILEIRTRRAQPEPTDRVRVALLQGNVAENLKLDPEQEREILENYRTLTGEALRVAPDLIVWPEAALPFTLPRDIRTLPAIGKWIGRSQLLTGVATASGQENEIAFWNSALVIGPDGGVRFRYDKQHLVPFGEYVPFSDLLPMRYIVPPVAGNFRAGSKPILAEVNGHPFGILICYEIIFPDLSLDFVDRGATFLVNITNDAWFDQTSGPYQHVRFGLLRAVETRRPVVRSANTGITTWFDPVGRIHTPTRFFTRGFVTADIAPSTERTFYVRHPYLIPLLMLVLLLFVVLRKERRHGG
ncbi:MAG: apolipoprotein N-acyltransferase [Pseudomonadota bacterium]